MNVSKVEQPCEERKRDVIHRKERSTTCRDHMQLNHPEHVMSVSLVGGAIKVCYVKVQTPLARLRHRCAPSRPSQGHRVHTREQGKASR
jgi:hypothetical protein